MMWNKRMIYKIISGENPSYQNGMMDFFYYFCWLNVGRYWI